MCGSGRRRLAGRPRFAGLPTTARVSRFATSSRRTPQFDKTRTALTVWLHACCLFATEKHGISVQHLQRTPEIRSYHTALAMLHRLRSALVPRGRDRLAGAVEVAVDETFIGGDEQGLRGGRQRGKKVLSGIAVEVREPNGIGRILSAALQRRQATAPRRDVPAVPGVPAPPGEHE